MFRWLLLLLGAEKSRPRGESGALFVFQCGWASCCLCSESSPCLRMPFPTWSDFSCKFNSSSLFPSGSVWFFFFMIDQIEIYSASHFFSVCLFPDFMQTWRRALASWVLRSFFLCWILPSCPRMPCHQGDDTVESIFPLSPVHSMITQCWNKWE